MMIKFPIYVLAIGGMLLTAYMRTAANHGTIRQSQYHFADENDNKGNVGIDGVRKKQMNKREYVESLYADLEQMVETGEFAVYDCKN